MKIINGFKVNMYVRIGDQPPKIGKSSQKRNREKFRKN